MIPSIPDTVSGSKNSQTGSCFTFHIISDKWQFKKNSPSFRYFSMVVQQSRIPTCPVECWGTSACRLTDTIQPSLGFRLISECAYATSMTACICPLLYSLAALRETVTYSGISSGEASIGSFHIVWPIKRDLYGCHCALEDVLVTHKLIT